MPLSSFLCIPIRRKLHTPSEPSTSDTLNINDSVTWKVQVLKDFPHNPVGPLAKTGQPHGRAQDHLVGEGSQRSGTTKPAKTSPVRLSAS